MIAAAMVYAGLAGVIGLKPNQASAASSLADAAFDSNELRQRFKAHRVLYRMSLGHADAGASISAAEGTMFYRFQPGCEGWDVETRVFMRLHYGARDAVEVIETTWSFESFESFDEKDFSFSVDHKRDGIMLEQYQGGATRSHGSFAGDNVEFEVPFPDGTLFPMRHLMRILKKAEGGERADRTTVFDGASTDNPYEVNSVILGRVSERPARVASGSANGIGVVRPPDGAAPLLADAGMTPAPAWRVRMAYFPHLDGMGVPDFEIEIDYRDDGVARRMVQDFGDFSLNLTPERFEALPLPACR